MKLTPLDIKKQEFKKTIRGYDAVEVESFLEMVAEEFESVIREKNALADDALKLKTQLQDYQNVERTLQDTLVTAQESMKASRESSEREAGTIVSEAEIKADRILEESKLKLASLKNELVLIKSQKDSIARRLKHLLSSQIELIEVLEMDDLGYGDYEAEDVGTLGDDAQRDETVQFDGVDEVLPNLDPAFQEQSPQASETAPSREEDAPKQAHELKHENPRETEQGDPHRRNRDHPDGGRSSITDHLILD